MTPKYIREECTEEELAHLFKSRTKRLKRLHNRNDEPRRVSPAEFYRRTQSMTVTGSDGIRRPVMGLSGIRPKIVNRKPN